MVYQYGTGALSGNATKQLVSAQETRYEGQFSIALYFIIQLWTGFKTAGSKVASLWSSTVQLWYVEGTEGEKIDMSLYRMPGSYDSEVEDVHDNPQSSIPATVAGSVMGLFAQVTAWLIGAFYNTGKESAAQSAKKSNIDRSGRSCENKSAGVR